MITTQSKEIVAHIDPLSITAEIKVESGNPVQNYNMDTGEYEPDRSLVPCVLMPYVTVYDPEGVMSGSRAITGAEWYEGAPLADLSNRITDGTDYAISASGMPTWSLKVLKNIDYDSPTELHCLFTFTDTRTNTSVTVERSIVLRTTLFDSTNYSVKIAEPSGWTINPLEETEDSDGKWLHTLDAQLYSGTEAVADANAAYWWQIKDTTTSDTTFRDITDDELEVWISGKDSSGNWTKQLTFDARFLQNASFRCRAAYYSGTRPSSPTNDELQATTTVKVEMPATLRMEPRQTAGIKLNAALTTSVTFELAMWYNKATIPTSKNGLFLIQWYVKSTKAGSTAKALGSGRTVTFVPANYSLDPAYGIQVYATVKLYAVHAIIVDSDGSYMAVDDETLLIAPHFV